MLTVSGSLLGLVVVPFSDIAFNDDVDVHILPAKPDTEFGHSRAICLSLFDCDDQLRI